MLAVDSPLKSILKIPHMLLKSMEFTALLSLLAGMQYFSPAHSAQHFAPELQLELNLCRL